MKSPLKPPKLLAEGLGTFFLVFIGCGAIVTDQIGAGRLSSLGVSLAFGLVVLSMVYALGHVSGAHLNPAVTLAFWRLGRMGAAEAAGYAAAQLAGASLGAATLAFFFPAAPTLGLTLPAGLPSASFSMECLLTAFLVFVVLRVATGARAEGILAGVAVGSTVALCAMIGGPVSGASMNPARSFGPALVRWDWTAQWIYWAAPLLGALAGVEAHRLLRCEEEDAAAAPGCC